MTQKQIEVLYYIYLHGSECLSHLSEKVLKGCGKRGWLEADGEGWSLTDAGRLALHEATQ